MVASDALDIRSRLEIAQVALGQGELADVEQALAPVLSAVPDHPHAIYLAACLYYERGDAIAAVRAFTRGLALLPGHAEIRQGLARAQLASGDLPSALEHLNSLKEQFPTSAPIRVYRGDALRRLGRTVDAESEYWEALRLRPGQLGAHAGLAAVMYPGPGYLKILEFLHRTLDPATYLEIGVETGKALRLAQMARLAVGVDPKPRVCHVLSPQTKVVCAASDTFFASQQAEVLFGENPVQLAFVDGLHLFEQALRDFIQIERWSVPSSVVAIHDCAPIDSLSASRVRRTTFWSGDVWKLILCLREYRGDLVVATVATAPTGLGLVSHLDPGSTVLAECYDEILARYVPLEYDDEIADERHDRLGIIASDEAVVAAWLRIRVAA
ncbi:MAG: tetratricopeptide repeat protein [Nannocystaceae bacterium]